MFLRILVLLAVSLMAADVARAETRTFSPAPTENFLNPERGLVRMLDVKPETLSHLGNMRAEGRTVALGLIQLKRGDVLPGSQRLTEIRAWLARVRQERVKAVLRVVYHQDRVFDSANEPTEAQAFAHLDALKQTFFDYGDVVLAHELGVLGAWGEWFYTPKTHTTAEARARLINKYFAVVPAHTSLMLRTAYYKKQYEATGASAALLARIGHFNDCFMSGEDGQEGYQCYPWPGSCPTSGTWKAMIAADSAKAPVGGETCTDLRNACTQVASQMSYLGWSFINPSHWSSGGKTNSDYWREILPSCEAGIRSRLGYRFELERAEVPASIDRTKPFTVSFTVKNTGYGTLTSARPVIVKLLDSATGKELVYWGTQANPRQWRPGQSVTTTATVTVPTWVPASQKVSLSIWIPDAATTLRATPDYSIRLASRTTTLPSLWTANAGGVNVIKSNIPMTAP